MQIWILGSSIPFWAGQQAATSSGGKNLNLPAKVQWFGHRVMQWHQLDPAIMDLLKRKAPPNYLMIHLGSNDLAKSEITSKKLVEEIKCSLLRYNALLSNTTLVWSSILPRLYWHGVPVELGKKINKKRTNVNRRIRSFILDLGGAVISHDNITTYDISLFRYDGTHLSREGNSIYLHNIQSAFHMFLNGEKHFSAQHNTN
jgi:hypothetical protein